MLALSGQVTGDAAMAAQPVEPGRRGRTAPANRAVTSACRSGGQAGQKMTVSAPAA
jgi:hypothetical protein